MSSTLAYTLASTVPAYLAYKVFTKPTTPASPNASLPLPPGPTPLPVLGNALNLTANELWLRAAEWADTYGDVTYLNVMGLGIMFVNTVEAANELMERRGALYADRMKTNMVDLCGCGDMVAFTGHGPQMRRQRRLMQRALGPASIKAYHPLMAAENVSFLRRLSSNPSQWRKHVSRYGGSLTLRVTYGYAPKATGTDPFLDLASQCVDALSMDIASTAKVWPVDLFSSLKNLPDWAPGAGFKRQAKEWKALMERFVDEPFAWARAQIAAGQAVPSFVSTILAGAADDKLSAEDEADLKWTANSMYSASLDTSTATITTLVLFLLQYPEIAARARAELDSVVGPSRLPNFNDRPNLPYIDALMNETLRCNCAVPLGLPHRVTQEDVYNGSRIPAGTLVFGNAWNMAHNPVHYPNPEVFDPTRFLGPTPAPDPRAYVFGFGRRKCPGQHIIESSLWLLLAGLLHAFDVLPEMDDEGQEVQRDVSWGGNPVFRAPSEFPVVFKVREGRAHLLDEEAA